MRDSPAGLDLRDRLLSVIEHGADSALAEAEFSRLAHDVFAFQYALNPIYRSYCDARGTAPDGIATWRDIPAVPTEAFKVAPLVCGDPGAAEAVFRTSGTTGGAARRGTHYLLDTGLYRAALRAGFRARLLPDADSLPIGSLIPPPADAADSSLSFMIGDVVETFGAEGSGFHVGGGSLRLDAFLAFAERAATRATPVMVVGTSFAFVHLLDGLAETGADLHLPPGSRVMDTGGFKGRSREIGRDELYEMIERGLGVPGRYIVNEYGMTEMSSQLYDGVAGRAAPVGEPRRHSGPAWLRTVVVDPETLRPVPDGQTGILRHYDLANLHSVMAIQAADLGRVTAGEIELLGRAPLAESRGCSIAMDDLLQVMNDRPSSPPG
ncbi:MAG: hypothetical protein WD737_08315 [Gemmatimonadota bacterium]